MTVLLQIHQLLAQDPSMLLAFGYKKKHAMFDDIFDHFGVPDSSMYLPAPDDPEYLKRQEFHAQQQQAQQQAQQQQLQSQHRAMRRSGCPSAPPY